MSWMFKGCTNLKEIPHLDTSKVIHMYSMFNGCTNFKEIPHLDTSKVTDMEGMFGKCINLKKIPHLDMSEMFLGCINLEYLESPEDFDSRYFDKEQNPLIYKNYLEMFL